MLQAKGAKCTRLLVPKSFFGSQKILLFSVAEKSCRQMAEDSFAKHNSSKTFQEIGGKLRRKQDLVQLDICRLAASC